MSSRFQRIINVCFVVCLILLWIILWQKCSGEKKVIKVDVPEVKGSFPAVEPQKEIIKIPVAYTVKDTAEINRLKKLYNYSQSEIDRILAENESLDSLAMATNDFFMQEIYKLSKYQEFSHPFENDTLSATVTGISRGPVDRLAIPEFKIKKRTVDVPVKELKFRVIVGGEVGVNKELNQGTWKANLFIQNKNNNLYSGSFQRIAGQDFYLAGFHKSIFEYKK